MRTRYLLLHYLLYVDQFNVHPMFDNTMVNTAKLYSLAAKRLSDYIGTSRITLTNATSFDFGSFVMNKQELDWVTNHKGNHDLFLKGIITKQLQGPGSYNPLDLVPLDDIVRLLQAYTDAMSLLHAARVARSQCVKKRFLNIQPGEQFVSRDGALFPRNARIAAG